MLVRTAAMDELRSCRSRLESSVHSRAAACALARVRCDGCALRSPHARELHATMSARAPCMQVSCSTPGRPAAEALYELCHKAALQSDCEVRTSLPHIRLHASRRA